MSDELAVPEGPVIYASKKERDEAEKKALLERSRKRFDSLVDKAITTVAELCEMGDSEAVRLDAAKTILKMAEVDPGTKKEVNVSVDDSRAVREEIGQILHKLEQNNPRAAKALTTGEVVDAELVDEE